MARILRRYHSRQSKNLPGSRELEASDQLERLVLLRAQTAAITDSSGREARARHWRPAKSNTAPRNSLLLVFRPGQADHDLLTRSLLTNPSQRPTTMKRPARRSRTLEIPQAFCLLPGREVRLQQQDNGRTGASAEGAQHATQMSTRYQRNRKLARQLFFTLLY